MYTVTIQPDFDAWRATARDLLARAVAPDWVIWSDVPDQGSLFSQDFLDLACVDSPPHVPKMFLELARTAAAHNDVRRWAVLYRVLWRLTRGGERHLLGYPTDPDMRTMHQWVKAVSREIHKMHAFVRFRLVGCDPESGREQFIAWFEPEFHSLRLAAGFFQKRFAAMDWSILTPHECVHWDGKQLHFTPGVPREEAVGQDALDALWRTYYRGIFNPARLKTKAMQSEMPKKYWKNLPEAEIIGELISDSRQQLQNMLDAEPLPVKPMPRIPYLTELQRKNARTGEAEPPDGG